MNWDCKNRNSMTFLVTKLHNFEDKINISWKISEFCHIQNQVNVFLKKMQFTSKTKIYTKIKTKTIQYAQKIEQKNNNMKKLTF